MTAYWGRPTPNGFATRTGWLQPDDTQASWLRTANVSARFSQDDESDQPAIARLEAAMFASDRGLSAGRLAKVAQLIDAKTARRLLDRLDDRLASSQSPFRVAKLASGYRLLTKPEYAYWLAQLHPKPSRVGLSPTALEALTIVAYRQPLTRADVEAVRGVQSLEILKQLADRGLIRIVGEDDSLGRPYLYGTTPLFLEMFGLARLEDLPDYESLSQPIA